MESIISLKNVSKVFDENTKSQYTAVKDISLEIKEGEFFMFVGPSGCGKSTLLRLMSGLEKKYSGEIKLADGISQKDFSFVFQQFALLPWLSVAENIALGLVARGDSEAHIASRVKKELALFGLEKFAEARPRELSGGMRQRVGIARALATDPKVVFMDEPFSELDSFTAEVLRKDLLAVWQERGITVVMVTHIVPEAVELADRVAVMSARPGRIEEIVEDSLSRPRKMRAPETYTLEDRITSLIHA